MPHFFVPPYDLVKKGASIKLLSRLNHTQDSGKYSGKAAYNLDHIYPLVDKKKSIIK